MIISNSGSENYIFYLGSQNILTLAPGSILEVSNDVYSGNSTFKSQVDNLISRGTINVYDKPADPVPVEEVPELPDTYEAGEQELVITKNDGVAAISVDTDLNEVYYGSVELVASGGSQSKLSAYCGEEDEAMLDMNKNSNELGNLLLLKINDTAVLQIGATGSFGFNGVEPVEQPALDPGSDSTEDIINALIDLGIFRSSV